MPIITTCAIKTRARTLLNEPTARFFLDSEMNSWIDEAVRDISTKTFCSQVIGSAFNTVAGTKSYAWASSLEGTAIHVLHVKAVLDSNAISIEYVPIDLFGRVEDSTRPKYTLWNRNILFTPTPTAIYSYNAYYITQTTQTAEGDLKLPTPYHHIVTLYVVAMGKEKRKDYDGAAQVFEAYNTELTRIYNTLTGTYSPLDERQRLKDQAPSG